MSKFAETVIAVVAIVVGSIYHVPWLVKLGVALLVDEAAQSLLSSPSSMSGANRPGDRIVQNNTLADATLIYGSMGHVGGPPSYWNTSGTNNEFLWYVIPVAMRPIDSFILLHLDSDTINLLTDIDGSGNVNTGKYNGFVRVGFHVGSIPATVDSVLTANFPTEYTSNFKGSACAYFWVRMMRDTRTDDQISAAVAPQNVRLFQSGPPGEVSMSLNGHHVYDMRLDSTNGGSGPVRMTDPTTWVFSANSALIARDYLTASGIYKTFYSNPGLNVGCLDWPTTIIDDVACATSANICDTTFNDTDAVAHAQFSCNGLIDCGSNYGDNLQLILTTMGGSLIPQGSKFQINAAQYVAPSFTIDETWIANKITIRQLQPSTQGDFYNAIRGNFIDGDQFYQGADFYPFTSPTYEANDKGRFWKDINLQLITNRYVAQRIAVLYGKMSRNQMLLVGTFNLKALNVAVGDTVSLTIAGIFNAKVFKVYNWKLSADGIEMQLREENSTPYSITTGELVPVSSPLTPGYVYPVPPPPTLVDAQGVADGTNTIVVPPPDALYKFMIVYRGTTAVRAAATYRGRFEGAVFHDHDLSGGIFYYWIYAVNAANQLSTALAYGPIAARWGLDSTGSAVNHMPAHWSVFNINNLIPTPGFIANATLTNGAGSIAGYNWLHLNPSANGVIWDLSDPPNAPGNIHFRPKKYIFSMMIRSSSTVNIANVTVQPVNPAGGVSVGVAAQNLSFAESIFGFNRYSCVIDMSSATLWDVFLRIRTGNSEAGHFLGLQLLMLEEMTGNNPKPSAYVAPQSVKDIALAYTLILPNGSVVPVVPDMTFTYSGTTTSITWTWPTFTMRRPDGSNTTVSSGSQGCTGLTNGTKYWFYPYLDETSNTVLWVGNFGGSHGSPAIAYGAATATAQAFQNRLGFVPLTANSLNATTGSGAGGTGGGYAGCLHPDQEVWTKTGYVLARHLTTDHELMTPKGWKQIEHIDTRKQSEWIETTYATGRKIITTPREPMYTPDDEAVHARDLCIDDILQGYEGYVIVTGIKKVIDASYLVQIHLGNPYLYYVTEDGPMIHNGTQKP